MANKVIYQRVATTSGGDTIAGAEYTVTNERSGTALAVYTDRTGTSAGTGPYFADVNGLIRFWVDPGSLYRVLATGGTGTYTDRYVEAIQLTESTTDTETGRVVKVGDDALAVLSGLGDAAAATIGTGDDEIPTNAMLPTSTDRSYFWFLSGAQYTTDSFDFSGEVSGLTSDVAFSADGLLLFVNSNNADLVYAYNLSVAWDVTTASYSGATLDYSGQLGVATCFSFSTDGLFLYIPSFGDHTIYAYGLTVAWDLSTASYSGGSYDLGAVSTNPESIDFSTDGTRLFVADATDDLYMFMFTLSTAWDITTATYSGDIFDLSGQTVIPDGLAFNANGLQFMVACSNTDAVYSYQLGKAWDLSTAVYSGYSLDTLLTSESPVGLAFSATGGTFYTSGQAVGFIGSVYAYRCPSLLQNR